MKKLDNKGFTLVELIGVMVILIIITAIAVPNISQSVERAKETKNQEVNKSFEYAIELYLSENKEKRTSFYNGNCYILRTDLLKGRYLMKDEMNTDTTTTYIIYSENKYIKGTEKPADAIPSKSKC